MNLVTDWTNYLLEPNGGTAVKLSLGGTPVVVGQFGASTPIAAQQTATGYEVALADVAANQYTVWDTDSTGNVVSAPMSKVSGTSAALEVDGGQFQRRFERRRNDRRSCSVERHGDRAIRNGEPVGGWEHLSDFSRMASRGALS